jgi:Carboxypeptidase regulatory-like domain/TonB dependent receptor-like, beta-barrel
MFFLGGCAMIGFSRLRIFLFCFLFALGISLSAWGQSAISTGSISGVVTDPSGAAIAGAAVTATNVATGTNRTTKTNGTGFYSFPSLKVGAYNVTVGHPGFKTTEIKNIVVQIGQGAGVNAKLEVGAVSQTVTVTGETPLLRATESTVSTVVSENLIQNLPLSGRRYTDFVLLTPNANADGDFGLVSIGGQQGGADSGYANGNGSNSFTVDGATASSNYFGEARGRTRVPYVFGEQSIQEFQVADNPYNAAYGGGGSGFVNTVTKSGGDAFHGDAFYYNRNSGVGNANDAVDKANGIPRPLDILQQFGADLGGPIVHHKAWFYFDYEQQRRKEPISIVIPNDAALTQTDFPNITSSTVLPPPNGPFPIPASFSSPPAPSDTTNYPIYLQQVSNALNAIHSNLNLRKRLANNLSFFPKIDWQPANADHFTFEYNYSKFDSPGGEFTFSPVNFAGDSYLANNFVRDHHATVHWTHTFGPTLLSDFHVSFTRDEQLTTPSGLIPASSPQVEMFGPGFIILGNANYSNADTKEYQWQINERMTYVTGRHTLDFGFDFDRTHITDFFAGNFYGSYAFFNPVSFALGHYFTFSQNVGNPLFPFTFPYYGFYAQDKFQVAPRLTLDFGLREDFQVYPQPEANTTLGPVIARLTGQFPNQYQRLAPRFGFAWQPLSKTVVRGGFGIFREVFDAINYENSVTGNGLPSRVAGTFLFYNSSAAPNAQTPAFPNALPSTAPVFSSSSNLSVVSPNFQTPNILESSLEIQRELLPSTTLTIGTMWTHGTHLIASSAYDLNLVPPTGTTTFTVCPGGFTSGPPEGCVGSAGRSVALPNFDSGLLTEGRLIPGYSGEINALISPGNNNYNSFYVKFLQRNFHGVSSILSYTFSKGLQSNGVDFNNQFDFSNTRGPSLLDQRHRLSIAAAYSPGAPSFSSGFARGLLSDWTISTVMQFSSGRPYTALLDCSNTAAGDNLNNSAANESTGNTAVGIAGSTAPCGPDPFVGFNAFYGPWTEEIDLGLSRGFHITERQVVSVTAQVFNLFNHPNFFVQNGSGINNSARFLANGSTCGDGATTTGQQCFLAPESGFGVPGEINQLNGPRIFQFAFRYQF